MMSRPMVLVFMLILLVITSQLEWKQPLVNELEMSPSISHKEQLLLRREVVKEKVILSQEKSIRKLNELVRKLQAELQQCRGSSTVNNETGRAIILVGVIWHGNFAKESTNKNIPDVVSTILLMLATVKIIGTVTGCSLTVVMADFCIKHPKPQLLTGPFLVVCLATFAFQGLFNMAQYVCAATSYLIAIHVSVSGDGLR